MNGYQLASTGKFGTCSINKKHYTQDEFVYEVDIPGQPRGDDYIISVLAFYSFYT